MSRGSWDSYFLNMATLVSTRATCNRKHVGCVMVKEHRVVSTGYNGSLPSQPHCDDVGHLMDNGGCIRTVHAEANAIAFAARHGVSLAGCTAYVTCSPCLNCAKLLVMVGIVRVVCGEDYRDTSGKDLLTQAGVEVVVPSLK